MPHGYVGVPAVPAAKCAAGVVPVWSRCGLRIVASGESAEPDRVQRPLRPTSWLGTNPKTMR